RRGGCGARMRPARPRLARTAGRASARRRRRLGSLGLSPARVSRTFRQWPRPSLERGIAGDGERSRLARRKRNAAAAALARAVARTRSVNRTTRRPRQEWGLLGWSELWRRQATGTGAAAGRTAAGTVRVGRAAVGHAEVPRGDQGRRPPSVGGRSLAA